MKDSPGIDTDQPVSRQMESTVYDHYGWAPYWPVGAGAYMPPVGFAGAGLAYPLPGAYAPPVAPQGAAVSGAPVSDDRQPAGDPHLRSVKEVTGYASRGVDDDVGHVEDILVDAEGWSIRYLIIDTGNWWAGKQVLVAPSGIDSIDWSSETVRVRRTRQEIKAAPEYDPARPVDRDYEGRLHRHYGAPTS